MKIPPLKDYSSSVSFFHTVKTHRHQQNLPDFFYLDLLVRSDDVVKKIN